MNIAADLLAIGEPDAPALIQGSRSISYGELRRASSAVAGSLHARNVQPGDRVVLLAENGPFFVSAYLGILLAGAIAVPVSVDLSPEDLSGLIADSGARWMLGTERQRKRWSGADPGCVCHVLGEQEALLGPAGHEPVDMPAATGIAALMFTSGSTGKPKGVVVTHRNIQSNTQDIVRYLGVTATDRVLLVLPLHYCFGLSVLHSHLAVGASIVLNNQFLYPQVVLDELERRQCTGFAGVPSNYQILLRKSRFKQMRFPALRWLQQAGGKLPNPFIQEILQAFPGVRFFTMYGQTEATARLSYLPPEQLPEKLGSIGQGLPSSPLQVLREDGSQVTPGSDEVGEIVASGDHITLGYWNDPDETARYFRHGRLHTGDLARVDADGFLYVVERQRDLIKAGGNRVSAKQIEDVLCELPEVVEAAAVGVPHELLGEAVAAFVVLIRDATVTEDALRTHCRRRLAPYQVPEFVRILPSLPHTANGKVRKTDLRSLAPHAPS